MKIVHVHWLASAENICLQSVQTRLKSACQATKTSLIINILKGQTLPTVNYEGAYQAK